MQENDFKKRSSGTSSIRFFSCLLFIITKQYNVSSFNLEIICTREFKKKLKLHLPKWLICFKQKTRNNKKTKGKENLMQNKQKSKQKTNSVGMGEKEQFQILI